MLITLVLVGRTIPGFTELADRVSRTFKARITTKMIDFPLTRSFRAERKQYDADILLDELSHQIISEGPMVFLVREDIFSEPMNFVFGLTRGKACIVSLARLDPRFYDPAEDNAIANARFKERILKEVLHELGHSLGLPHCEDKRCTQVFSDCIDGVDFKEKSFCAKCRKALNLQD